MKTARFDRQVFGFAVLLGVFLTMGVAPPKALAMSIPDAWITTEAKLSLVTQNQVSAADVHVDTQSGQVILYGKVTSEVQRQHAETAVRSLDGVKGVKNLLQVVPRVSEKAIAKADDRIMADVDSALREDPTLADSHVSVKSVDNGAVLLTGNAKSLYAHWNAVQTASSIPGVRSVTTEIAVANLTPSDTELARAATDAKDIARDSWTTAEVKLQLLADGDVPALEVGVDTNHGIVSLVGTVPTVAAKSAAVADAQRVKAVVGVNDDLQVRPVVHFITPARDEVVKQNVEAVLRSSPEFNHVAVDVKDGRVHLTGMVASGWVRLRAATAVRATKGVRSVDDDLRLIPTTG